LNSLIDVDSARNHIVERIPRLPVERVPLQEACGRVIAQMVLSPGDFPHADLSAMDGYAIRAADGACETFVLQGESAAGHPFDEVLKTGHCVRIFTGAALPLGTDAVIMQEDASVDGGALRFTKQAYAGLNVRSHGSHLKKGQIVCDVGFRLSASDIGVLASFGLTNVDVFAQPRVAILSTGDELCDLGEPLKDGQIHNSNAQMLAALVRTHGGLPTVWPVVRDVFDDMTRALELACKFNDLVVTIGGVSVGDHDHVSKAMTKVSGDELVFWKIRMKPGKPLAFGVSSDGTAMVGLPGNPLSAFVCFHQFVRPALATFQGTTHAPLRVSLPTAQSIRGSVGRREFIPGRITMAQGGAHFEGPAKMDSGNSFQLMGVSALAVLQEDCAGVTTGDQVQVEIL
jgi:molybdopterin molybdotransferase